MADNKQQGDWELIRHLYTTIKPMWGNPWQYAASLGVVGAAGVATGISNDPTVLAIAKNAAILGGAYASGRAFFGGFASFKEEHIPFEKDDGVGIRAYVKAEVKKFMHGVGGGFTSMLPPMNLALFLYFGGMLAGWAGKSGLESFLAK